jgi:hypothetical protein
MRRYATIVIEAIIETGDGDPAEIKTHLMDAICDDPWIQAGEVAVTMLDLGGEVQVQPNGFAYPRDPNRKKAN